MKINLSIRTLVEALAVSFILLEIYRRFATEKTACDFLVNHHGRSFPSVDYYANNGELFLQHKDCYQDSSRTAKRIKLIHDDETIANLEANDQKKVTISIFGGSGATECHSDWASAVRIGYEYEKLGYRVFQGGGRGLMMALRIGSDLFCHNLEAVEHVITLMCEAETATDNRKAEIASFITENYATCHPKNSYSLHSAIYLPRLPIKPYIGFSAERIEFYNDYSRLKTFIELSDVWLIMRGSEGVQAEMFQVFSILKYAYLTPEKQQQCIIHNGTNWVDRGYLTSHQLSNPLVVKADSTEKVILKTNEFIQNKYCSTKKSIMCPATLFHMCKDDIESKRCFKPEC